MENPIEHILKDKGPRGLSLRQLSFLTGSPIHRVKYHIYNSMQIKDCEPFIHGSYKSKIRVFCYTPEIQKDHSRKIKKKFEPVLEL
jgi:hypothetical protein